jgi:CRP/FNR family cyclic AMP-dependent transcriptional regulator
MRARWCFPDERGAYPAGPNLCRMTDIGQPNEEHHALIARTFGCPVDLAELIARKAHLRDHLPRTTIVHGDDPAAHVYLVFAGHARMLAFAFEGRMSVIEDYQRGDLFGERGLFGEAVSPHDVTAVLHSRIGAFANPEFLGLMTNHACIALAVSRILVARLEAAQRRLAEGATLSAKGLICAELLRLARAGQDLTITPAPVLAQLALTVGSARETVSRTIASLERRGIIQRDGDGLTLVAPQRLEDLIV